MSYVDAINQIKGFNAFGQSGGDNERYAGSGRALVVAELW
jgi:hypothetical protein